MRLLAHEIGERLDHLSFRYYKDAERFWRICDANRAMRPVRQIVATARSIILTGQLDERVPVRASEDELDELSGE